MMRLPSAPRLPKRFGTPALEAVMVPGSIEHRLRLGRDLLAGRIDEAGCLRELGGAIGLGRDDLALLTIAEIEARKLAHDLPLDIGQLFSEFAQQIEDPISTLRAALAAEAEATAREAA